MRLVRFRTLICLCFFTDTWLGPVVQRCIGRGVRGEVHRVLLAFELAGTLRVRVLSRFAHADFLDETNSSSTPGLLHSVSTSTKSPPKRCCRVIGQ